MAGNLVCGVRQTFGFWRESLPERCLWLVLAGLVASFGSVRRGGVVGVDAGRGFGVLAAGRRAVAVGHRR